MDTTALKKLALEYHSSGKELSWNLAAEYLSKIPESQLGREDIRGFMIQFREAPPVQKYAALYLSKLPGRNYTNPENDFFIKLFKGSDAVQNIVFKYLNSLNPQELKQKISLVQTFKDVPAAKAIGSKYLKSLSEEELYTSDNLILLGSSPKVSMSQGSRYFITQNPVQEQSKSSGKRKTMKKLLASSLLIIFLCQGICPIITSLLLRGNR